MRTLTDHIVSGDQAVQLQVLVTDEPGAGGANHLYQISGFDAASNPSNLPRANSPNTLAEVLFQNGPIKEVGVNGVTQEVLLAIVIDRLRSFQAGPYACKENEMALSLCLAALYELQSRTRARIARGVEGTHTK